MQSKQSLLDPRSKKQFTGCFFTFMLNGVLSLSIGAMLPYLRTAYGLDYAFAGMLVSLHSVGNLIACFASGVLPLVLGKRKSVVLFSCSYALAFILMLSSANPFVLAFAFICTGLARGSVSNFNNRAVNEFAPGKAWALNALHASFAFGAFLAPFMVLFCAGSLGDWRIMCGVMIVFGLLELLVYVFIPIENDRVEKANTEKGNYGFLKEKQFYITIGTLFFYLCAEQGVIGFMVTYFKDSGLMSEGYAQAMASVLWILILAGRLTVAWASSKVNKSRLLLFMGAGFVAFFIVVMLGKTLPVITLGIAGFGFSMAGIYPTTVSLNGKMMQTYPMAWNIILTLASVGAIVMPSIVGAVAETAGITMGMSTIVFAVVLTMLFIIANAILHKNDNA